MSGENKPAWQAFKDAINESTKLSAKGENRQALAVLNESIARALQLNQACSGSDAKSSCRRNIGIHRR
jgi:hypothetical protein